MKKRHPVKQHTRRSPTRRPKAAPAPGQTEFSPDEEQAMRAGARQARMAPMPSDNDGDEMGDSAGIPPGL